MRSEALENKLSSRKIKRNQEKRAKKKLKKDVQEKMNMFDKLQEECLSCQTPFDKTNRDMVSSWFVTVREDKVNLYCPTCWAHAQKIVKEYLDGQANTKSDV